MHEYNCKLSVVIQLILTLINFIFLRSFSTHAKLKPWSRRLGLLPTFKIKY